VARGLNVRNGGPPGAGGRPTLVIMAKLARMGQVKTRLGRQVGPVLATAFYRTNLAAIVGRLGYDRRWRTVLAVSPDPSVANAGWPAAPSLVRRSPQGRGDLGQRMHGQLLRRAERGGRGPVVIIGTDIPTIRPKHIAAAFQALGNKACVFGPAPDGGFWLVGQRRVPRLQRLFSNVRWSSAETLSDCLSQTSSAEVALIATLPDVDTGEELAAVSAWFGRRILPHDVGR
jgi:uncharacterized protein